MKLIIILLSINLLCPITSLTFWFSIGPGNPTEVISPVTISGPNQEYIIHGAYSTFYVYSINWESGTASKVKDIPMAADGYLTWNCRLHSDWTHNAVLASKTLVRFNAEPGKPINSEKYTVVTDGTDYSYPQPALGTVYMFVASLWPAPKQFFRIHSDRVTGVQKFPLGTNSRAYGVLQGTPWVLASADGTNQRKLFDYTNGHNGGTNSVADVHPKPNTNQEIAFLSPEDGREYYLVTELLARIVRTVKTSDGSELLNHNVFSLLTQTIVSLSWVYDTDLCALICYANGIILVDFMAKTRTPFLVTLPSGGGTFHGEI